MAVAHSASSESHTGTTGSANQASFNWTHTQTGTPQGVVVFVHVTNSSADTVTSVTYGTVTLDRIAGGAAIDAAGESIRADLFFAGKGLPSGNQTVTVNRTNNTNILYATASTVTAATDTNVTGIVLLQGDGTLTQQNVDDGSPGSNSLRYAGATSGLNSPPTAGANSTLLQSIDVGNQTCSLVRETTAGQGSRPVGFSGSTDDRAAIHVAVRELFNRSLAADVGSFTLSGNNATLARNPDLFVDKGTFLLTGNQASLTRNLAISAETGTYTLTGNDVTLTKSAQSELSTLVGTFSLTGNAAITRHNPAVLSERGVYTLTGLDVTFAYDVILSADAGTFSLTGNDTTFLKGYKFLLDKGTFNLTGNNVTFEYSQSLNVDAGSFTLSGLPAAFSRSKQLFAAVGVFSLTGNPISFTGAPLFSVDVGVFSVTGPDVVLNYEQRRRVVFVF